MVHSTLLIVYIPLSLSLVSLVSLVSLSSLSTLHCVCDAYEGLLGCGVPMIAYGGPRSRTQFFSLPVSANPSLSLALPPFACSQVTVFIRSPCNHTCTSALRCGPVSVPVMH